jgi:putative NIF3 family GTP cyclohydrolase 1 type 2
MAARIQNVVDVMIGAVEGAPWADSVDTFKAGDPAQTVTGVVTTFTATMDVLRRAVELGANLIVTHEPTYYDHRDDTGWLSDDPVYVAKRAFIEERGLTIWRFHDYWHRHSPDGIITGVVRRLGWERYLETADDRDWRVTAAIPPVTVAELVDQVKQRLELPLVRTVADPAMTCRRVGLLIGGIPAPIQIRAFVDLDLDCIMAGEITEWQVCEYVRDAIAQGRPRALIAVGHARSEEDGMRYLAEWLGERLDGVAVTHVPVGNPFTFA